MSNPNVFNTLTAWIDDPVNNKKHVYPETHISRSVYGRSAKIKISGDAINIPPLDRLSGQTLIPF